MTIISRTSFEGQGHRFKVKVTKVKNVKILVFSLVSEKAVQDQGHKGQSQGHRGQGRGSRSKVEGLKVIGEGRGSRSKVARVKIKGHRVKVKFD